MLWTGEPTHGPKSFDHNTDKTPPALLNFYSAFLQKHVIKEPAFLYDRKKKRPYMGNVEINIINTNVNTIQDEA